VQKDPKVQSADGDSIREKAVSMLKEAMGEKGPDDTLEPAELALAIEKQLFSQCKNDTNRDYKAKIRSLAFNLKNPKNPNLRNSLTQGVINVVRLCTMSVQEMADEELKKERARIVEWHTEASKIRNLNQTSTGMFKCGKCGKRDTTYYQMQTRSADEPMTTFHTCCNCGHRWKS